MKTWGQLSELVAKTLREDGDGPIDFGTLILMVDARPEMQAREEIVREIIKAKREAGFEPEAVFFKVVWPSVFSRAKHYDYLRSCTAGDWEELQEVRLQKGVFALDIAIAQRLERGEQ